MKFFAQENAVSVKDLEEALLQWRLKSTASKPTELMSLNQNVKPTAPPFKEQVFNIFSPLYKGIKLSSLSEVSIV